MRRILLSVAAALAVTFACSLALAGTVETSRTEDSAAGFGTKIDALALTATRWTVGDTTSGRAWINVSGWRGVAFDIDFTDANSSCTAVKMVCETDRVKTGAADSGKDIHIIDCTGGVCDSTPLTWCYGTDAACSAPGGPNAAPGSKEWTWTVTNIPAPYLNCAFSATGTPAAADVITVFARGISP